MKGKGREKVTGGTEGAVERGGRGGSKGGSAIKRGEGDEAGGRAAAWTLCEESAEHVSSTSREPIATLSLSLLRRLPSAWAWRQEFVPMATASHPEYL